MKVLIKLMIYYNNRLLIIFLESFTNTTKSNIEVETQLTSGNDNETTPTEKTPLVAPPPHTDEPPPPYTDEAPPIDSSPHPHPLRKLIDAIFPFTSVNFKSSSLLSKIFQIIKVRLGGSTMELHMGTYCTGLSIYNALKERATYIALLKYSSIINPFKSLSIRLHWYSLSLSLWLI